MEAHCRPSGDGTGLRKATSMCISTHGTRNTNESSHRDHFRATRSPLINLEENHETTLGREVNLLPHCTGEPFFLGPGPCAAKLLAPCTLASIAAFASSTKCFWPEMTKTGSCPFRGLMMFVPVCIAIWLITLPPAPTMMPTVSDGTLMLIVSGANHDSMCQDMRPLACKKMTAHQHSANPTSPSTRLLLSRHMRSLDCKNFDVSSTEQTQQPPRNWCNRCLPARHIN